MQTDTFKTMSGKDVELRIYVASNNLPKVDYAMESLKKSMKWDEDVFGELFCRKEQPLDAPLKQYMTCRN